LVSVSHWNRNARSGVAASGIASNISTLVFSVAALVSSPRSAAASSAAGGAWPSTLYERNDATSWSVMRKLGCAAVPGAPISVRYRKNGDVSAA
jgi:hypothetical protein